MVRDSFRAQYYLGLTEECMEAIKRQSACSIVERVTSGIIDSFCDMADQIILPVVAHEVHVARQEGRLVGTSPEGRYQSFFLLDGKWTPDARDLMRRYPVLHDMLRVLSLTMADNVSACLRRFAGDREILERRMDISLSASIVDIQVLGSDRHRGGRQALMVSLDDGNRVIYKAVSLGPESFFRDYLTALRLAPGYDIKAPITVDMGEYGWIEYIPHVECAELHQLRSYYRRAGVLLAVTDSINYCDGHMDNLIACGEYPVLIDCETIFQCFSWLGRSEVERSLLFTGLLEKAPEKDSGRGFTAALQTPSTGRFEFLFPYAVEDGTDLLQVRMQGFTNDQSVNMAVYEGRLIPPHEYAEEICDGYSYAYDQISRHGRDMAFGGDWERRLAGCRTRQLIRHTLYYLYLIRRLQQPELACDRTVAMSFLSELLVSQGAASNGLVGYEISDLMALDIPYFAHSPVDRDLEDGNGKKQEEYFSSSAIEQVRAYYMERGNSHKRRSLDIIRNVVPQSPYPYKARYRE